MYFSRAREGEPTAQEVVFGRSGLSASTPVVPQRCSFAGIQGLRGVREKGLAEFGNLRTNGV